MQFVIQMASSSGCGSRSLHSLVPDLTSRAVHAFAATGADPERLANEIEVRPYALNIMHIYSKMHIIINFILYFIHLLVQAYIMNMRG